MIISIPKETKGGETRVAISPEIVKKYKDWGMTVRIEKGAGEASGFDDESFHQAGAEIMASAEKTYHGADIILKIWAPDEKEAAFCKRTDIDCQLSGQSGQSRNFPAGKKGDYLFFLGFNAADIPGAKHGYFIIAEQSGRLCRGYQSRQQIEQGRSADDDCRRNNFSRTRFGFGRRRSRAASHCHGKAPGRTGLCFRRPPSGKGTSRIAGRKIFGYCQ